MGTWGTSLHSDDTAADLRGDWSTGIRWGRQPEELTDELAKQYGADDSTFWLALADLQWSSGHLLPRVRDKALEIIAGGTDLDRWKDAGEAERRSRRAVLNKLRARLQTEPPAPKVIKRPRGADTPMKIGEIYSWRLLDGRFAFFQIAGIANNVGVGRAPSIRVLDRVSDDIPSTEDLASLPSRKVIKRFERMEQVEPTFLEHPQVCFGIFGPAQVPKNRLQRLGMAPLPPVIDDDKRKVLGSSWLSADEIMATVYGIGWWVGEILAWRREQGAPVIFSIASIETIRDGGVLEPFLKLELLDWLHPELPTPADLPNLRPYMLPPEWFANFPDLVPSAFPPEKRLTRISVAGLPARERIQRLGHVAREPLKAGPTVTHWADIDSTLSFAFRRPNV